MPFCAWRKFSVTEVEKAPQVKGVYQLCSSTGVIVYIGSSESSIRSRVVSHKGKTRFMKVAKFRYMRVADGLLSETAKHVERRLCDKFRKEHGGQLPRLQERQPKRIDILDWFS